MGDTQDHVSDYSNRSKRTNSEPCIKASLMEMRTVKLVKGNILIDCHPLIIRSVLGDQGR